jgi:hypothetical protein
MSGYAQWDEPAGLVPAARLPGRAGLRANGDGTWSYTDVPAEITGVLADAGDGTAVPDATTTTQTAVRLARGPDGTITAYGTL